MAKLQVIFPHSSGRDWKVGDIREEDDVATIQHLLKYNLVVLLEEEAKEDVEEDVKEEAKEEKANNRRKK